MEKEPDFRTDLMATHTNILRDKLGHIWFLDEAFKKMSQRENANRIYQIAKDYLGLAIGALKLNDTDLEVVKRACNLLGGENTHSAVHETPAVLLEKVSGHKNEIVSLVKRVVNPASLYYRSGINTLAKMMTNARDLRVDGGTPSDDDPRSAGVIWGWTKGDPEHPEVDIHFIVAHGLERIVTEGLRGTRLWEVAQYKDWLLTIMTAKLALDVAKGEGPGTRLVEMWLEKRPDGLGWIDQRTLDAYKQAYSEIYSG